MCKLNIKSRLKLTYRLYGEKGQNMKFFERIRKFFDIRLAPDEIIHLTIVQIRAL